MTSRHRQQGHARADISFDSTGKATRISVDGRDVSDEIRTPEVDRIVSKVAAYPGVREAMLPVQRLFARDRDVVAEGRDIGTVVFPDADVKVFLTADPRERARRRVLQRHAGADVPAARDQGRGRGDPCRP